MIEFVTNPIAIILGKDRFKLAEEFIVKYYDYTIIVPQGFESDLDSIPRIPIFYMLLKNRCPKSAIFHDYLYTTKPFSREECDKAFLCAMKAEGLGWFTRMAMYRGVRIGGGAYYNK